MLRAVIDTNVLVSSILSKRGAPAQLVDVWREHKFTVVTSEAAIAEAERVLKDMVGTGKYRITPGEITGLLLMLRTNSEVVPGQANVNGAIPADPDDEKFLAIALDGQADIIVSGDKHLLRLGSFHGIPILTPRQFLDQLEQIP
jgi:putative PIN family toxin of toxin-antitoxin system